MIAPPLLRSLAGVASAILFALLPAPLPATDVGIARAPGAAIVIPFDYRNDFIVVDARINGIFSAELLFDTGSEHTIITEPLLFGALNAEAVEPIRIVGSDLSTSIQAALSRRNSLSVAGLFLSNQPVIAVDDAALDLTALAGENIAGILGTGSFGAYVIQIDYRRQIIRLTPPQRFKAMGSAIRIPLDVADGKPYITLATRVHGAYSDSLRFLLDTGAALEALVFAHPDDSTLYPPRVVAGVIGHGLGGTLAGFVGRSDTIYLPGRPLADVVTYFQIVGQESRRDSVAARNGIIGNGILRQFHVAIDGPGGAVYLTPRAKPPPPRPYDRSGLTLIDEPMRRGAARVQFVAPGTPAAEAGLLAGDRVRKIDGIPVRLLSTVNLRRRLRRRVGRSVTLQIDRDGETLVATFQLRELI